MRVLRRAARRRASGPDAGLGRDQGLGRAQRLLLPVAERSRQALRLRSRPAVGRTARGGPAPHSPRQRRREDRVRLHQRQGPQDLRRARLRRRAAQHRAALARDRFDRGQGRARQVPHGAALPRLRRHAAEARGALRVPRPRRAAAARSTSSTRMPLAATQRLLRGARTGGERARSRRRASCARSASGCASSTTSGSTYLSLDRAADTLSGGEASASAWPRRSAPA